MSHPHHPHGQHTGGHPTSHGHAGHPASQGHGDHPETIKETYSRIKDDTSGKPAIEYMKNMKNQLRLVFWETTVGCNLECVHCRRLDVSTTLAKDDMTTKEAFALVDAIVEVGRPILVLSGGEPLFRPDIFDIAKYAVSKGLSVALATNGTLVDDDTARNIVDAGIVRVSISFDGADAKTHDEFRKIPGSFERSIAGFKRLKDLGMSMQINCTIAKHNVEQIDDLYNMALKMGADAIHIFMLVPVGCGVQIAADQMLHPKKYEEVLNHFYDLSKEAKIQTKATCAPHYFRIMRERAKEEGITISPKTHGMAAMTKGCLAGTGVCFVSHKGEVFPCGYLPVEAGHVKKQKFVDIWNDSPVFQ
ncbi:MAG TPA: radical SAM protein, partial [Candidatus Wunengus sp. YC61]|uniref:radical SAM protein n=1 Tax=Candidatus Wunengus sp. YC61 TaxID=3367698 RepID=UPI004024DEAD